jgi:selenocysteine lyase/cysteine desulfurase
LCETLFITDGYAALNHCFKFLASVDGVSRIHAHTMHLHKYTLRGLRELTHATGLRLCALYGANDAEQDSSRLQGSSILCLMISSVSHGRIHAGPVIAFNAKYANGSYVPYSVVEVAANSSNIALRTGGLCAVY